MDSENLNSEQENNKANKTQNNSFLREGLLFVRETLSIVIICLIIVVAVRHYLIQPFFVNGKSMEPNFYNGEYLIVDELSYRFNEPARGDVIVFKYPNDPSQFYIKRIVGLPNEKVVIENNRIIIYNDQYLGGMALDESLYLASDIITKSKGLPYYNLGDDEYFVLGDNRNVSADSRFWGALDDDLIVGRAWIRAWPFDRFKMFEGVEY
jgi:signal peptidase I